MFGWLIGAGLAVIPATDQEMSEGPYPALEAAATYRPSAGFGVGLRARVSRVDAQNSDFGSCPGGQRATSLIWDQRASMRTLDVGATAEVVRGRWLIQPWLGAHLAKGYATTTFVDVDPACPPAPAIKSVVDARVLFTGGVLVALDLSSPERRDRLSIFVDAQLAFPRQSESQYATAVGWEPGTFYDAVTFGIAYRR